MPYPVLISILIVDTMAVAVRTTPQNNSDILRCSLATSANGYTSSVQCFTVL